ncbi:MAG: hypothetical protein LBH20_04985 [Treponema sp.]|nr:hypothetical protein [Treponema sp.]
MKPVDIRPFLKDPRVGGTGGDVDIDYENPKDIPPELEARVAGVPSEVAADGEVKVSLSALGSVTITVTNADQYDDDGIEWYYDGNPVANGAALDMSLPDVFDVFNVVRNHPVTVTGEKDGKYYSILFYIKVES